ncbi:MAG: carboxypeptidase-like regulatory domain-containing protein [Candidatus Solibacter sp.]|nr:carboxypeptidase-like regulatory domain-containing protein [Candidatus Solibacter sp.]
MPSRILSTIALLAAAGVTGGYAQTTSGSIAGGVVDQQQSAVPGAAVHIKDAAKGFSQSAVTDREGRFVFPQLSPGTYTLDIEGKGFKRMERTNLELVANDKLALGSITLEVGAVTDTVTVTGRLTLDYGMRFYWIQPQFDEALQTSNFLPDQFSKADAPRLYRPVCVGNSAPCSGTSRRAADPSALVAGFVPTAANTIDGAYIGRIVPNTGKLLNGILQAGNGIEKGLYRNRGIHFAPRIGFAYDLKGDQSIVVRGGGGMFYDRPQGNVVFDLLTNPPTTLSPTYFFGQMQTLNTGQVLLAPPALLAYDHEGKSPTSYAFNLGVQLKLPMDSVLDVYYVGTLGAHLLQRRNINAPAYGAAYQAANQDPTLAANSTGANALPVDFLRPYQGFGNQQRSLPAVQRLGVHCAGSGKRGTGIGTQLPVPLADQQLGRVDGEGIPL